jgi:hypothetical protein
MDGIENDASNNYTLPRERVYRSRCLASTRGIRVHIHRLMSGIYEVRRWDGLTCHETLAEACLAQKPQLLVIRRRQWKFRVTAMLNLILYRKWPEQKRPTLVTLRSCCYCYSDSGRILSDVNFTPTSDVRAATCEYCWCQLIEGGQESCDLH